MYGCVNYVYMYYIHNIAMYVCMYMVVLCAVNDELWYILPPISCVN